MLVPQRICEIQGADLQLKHMFDVQGIPKEGALAGASFV
jgi:hypothetical protein